MLFYTYLGQSSDLFLLIEAICSILSLVILWITLLQVKNEIREMRTATYADVYKTITEILQEKEVRSASNFVINKFPKRKDKLRDYEIELVDLVCTTYDTVGQFIKYNLIPKEFVIKNWGYSIIACWTSIHDYIDSERNRRNAPELWDDFQWLVGESIIFRSN